jgi:hypothetical protein
MHNSAIFLVKRLPNIHIFAKKGVWKDLDEKQLWYNIKQEPSK